MRLRWQSKGWILALAAGACASEPVQAEVGAGCTLSSDCVAPLACVFSRCHAACTTNRDCVAGQRCVISDDAVVCQLDQERDCTYTSDCPQGQVCAVDLQCRTECVLDRDCPAEQLCVQHTCATQEELVDGELPAQGPPSGAPCSYDSECPPMMICRQERCVFDCVTDIDCQPMWTCNDEHRCVEPGVEHECVPNQQQHCPCDGGTSVKVCNSMAVYGPCSPCSSGTGGGAGGAGGAGSTSSSSSSTGGAGGMTTSSSSVTTGTGGTGGMATSSSSVTTGTGGTGAATSSSSVTTGTGGGGAATSSSNVTTGTGGGGAATSSSNVTTGTGGGGAATSTSSAATGTGGIGMTTMVIGGSGLEELIVDPGSSLEGGTYLGSQGFSGAASAIVGVDDSGEIMVSGTLQSSTDFGGGSLPTDGNDIYTLRLDMAGLHVRSEALPAEGPQRLTALVVDGNGNVVLAGGYDGDSERDFCGGPSAGAGSFLTLRDAAGQPLWCESFSGPRRRIVSAAAMDGAGNVVITGSSHEGVTFAPGARAPRAGQGLFAAKLDAAGRPVWSKRFSGAGIHAAYGVAVGWDETVVVTGAFEGSVDFGGGPLTSRGGTDVFVVKLSAHGDHLWSARFGDALDQAAAGVSVDGHGHIVVAGYFNGTIDLGGGPMVSAGRTDAFVARLDPAGGLRWSRRLGGVLSDRANSVTTDGLGAVIIGGSFEGEVEDGDWFTWATGSTDAFVAKLDPGRGSWLWRRTFGNSGAQHVQRVVAAPSGIVVFTVASSGGPIDFGAGPAVGQSFLVQLAP